MRKVDLEAAKKIEDTEILISNALRIGVVLSAAMIGLGLLLFILTGNSGYHGNTFPTSLVDIMRGLISLKPYAVILTGLLLLILTPVFRVGISIITFFKGKGLLVHRDYFHRIFDIND